MSDPQQKNPLERRVDLSIALDDFNRLVEGKLKKMQPNVKLQGFRKGKVPLAMVRKMYGQEAYGEAFNESVQKAFAEKIKEEQLRVVATPFIEPKKSENEKELLCTAIFEVYPEFELKNLEGISIKRPTFTVSEKEVEKTIDVLQKQRVRYEIVERAAQKNDRVTVDFVGKKDGVEFQGGKGENTPFILGQKMMLAEFENNVEGLKQGEEKTFPLTFPEDYFQKDLAGQTVEFWVKLKEVAEPHFPLVDEAFAQQLGIAGGVDVMKKEIEENLSREVKTRIERRVKNQVMDALILQNPIDLPQALVQMESEHLALSAKENMARQGMKNNPNPIAPEWFKEEAKRRVHLGLILAKVTDTQNVKAEKEDVRRWVEELAAVYEKPEELVSWYYANPERLKTVEALALEEKVVEWALSSANVEEEAADFDELMKN